MAWCTAHVRFRGQSGHDISQRKCLLLTQSGQVADAMISGMSALVHEIEDTFFDLQPKLSNIKKALIVLISPTFYIQLFAKCCIFGRNFLHPNSLPS